MTELSFRLSNDFVSTYKNRDVPWGNTDAAGNSVGEITFLRTYSRLKDDGTKERWWEVCRRVIEGTFSIQKDHCKLNKLPWNDNKAQKTAQDAFERMFVFKWTPPGRGLWVMGTPIVNELRNSAALQNCAFVSTSDMTKADPSWPFAFLMEASMLGVGVGFDLFGADKEFMIHEPSTEKAWEFVVEDSREGWVQAFVHKFESFMLPNKGVVTLDTSLVRREGEPIKTFGGTAAGPDPLLRLVNALDRLFSGRASTLLTRRDIHDVGNLIGVCVVSGNVRRSAELAQSSLDDKDFITSKNYEENPYRSSWGWMSNNSVIANVDDDLSHIIDSIKRNGEPGVVWLDLSRQYGRLIDPPTNADHRVKGYNPCAEQSLESGEMCTLVETYINRHETLEDYQKTLKIAYLYAKTVTLLPTHWPKTNAIMQRNRRIGTSVAGITTFADNRGMTDLRTWFNKGYETVEYYDHLYSEWLCVRESIKKTTVKPGGTTPLLAGEKPGAHWGPGGEYHERGIVFQKDDPFVALARAAGYVVEVSAYTPETSVFIQFPIHSNARRSDKEVSIFEKANIAVLAQRYWSDNSVSVTLSFNAETEAEHVGTVLHMHAGQLKTVSFLPQGNETYEQMPYQGITPAEYDSFRTQLQKIDLTPIYNGGALDAEGEAFCTTDACEIKLVKTLSS